MTMYEFYINNDGIFCCTRSDNPNFRIENLAAVRKIESLSQPIMGRIRINNRNLIIESSQGSFKLVNYNEILDAKIDPYLNKIFSKIKQELAKEQKRNIKINLFEIRGLPGLH